VLQSPAELHFAGSVLLFRQSLYFSRVLHNLKSYFFPAVITDNFRLILTGNDDAVALRAIAEALFFSGRIFTIVCFSIQFLDFGNFFVGHFFVGSDNVLHDYASP